MSDRDRDQQALAGYHPLEFPPRAWDIGPSGSERDARGLSYFNVGRGGIRSIVRDTGTGDVYVHCQNGMTMIHARMGWAAKP